VKKKPTSAEPRSSISEFYRGLNPVLFSHLDDVVGVPLTVEHQRVALLLETIELEAEVKESGLPGGRPFYSLKPTARALLAKSALNIPTTKDLIARLNADFGLKTLCGFGSRVPSESTFSRHVKKLSEGLVLDAVHEKLVRRHLGSAVVPHVSRDSSEIRGREKATPRAKPVRPKRKGNRGRYPSEGSVYKAPSRLPKQLEQDYRSSFKELPRACDIGTKTNSQGYQLHWIGFKLHLDVSDQGFPLSAFTSSASLHDSQAAIPLSQMTKERVGTVFYELMDKGYDSDFIRKAVERQGHVPIIMTTDRFGQKAIPLDEAQARRFKERTTVERSFSDIKDNLGGRFIRVRGAVKVHMHLMCAVLNLFACALLRNH